MGIEIELVKVNQLGTPCLEGTDHICYHTPWITGFGEGTTGWVDIQNDGALTASMATVNMTVTYDESTQGGVSGLTGEVELSGELSAIP